MRNFFVSMCIFLFTFTLKAQENLYTWTPEVIAGFNFSQVSFSNWAKGGDNSLSWSIIGSGSYNYKSSDWRVTNSLKIAFGKTQIGDEASKQNENEIWIENLVARDFGWIFKAALSNTFNTQITTGFDYKSNPAVAVADFFDPAYIYQGIGLLYDESPVINTRLDLALREVFTNTYNSVTDDPSTPEIEKFKLDIGLSSTTNLNWVVDENLVYKSSLFLFSAFNKFDIWDVRWENTISAQVNSWFSTNLSVILVYDEDQIQKTQVKQALQIGIVFRLL